MANHLSHLPNRDPAINTQMSMDAQKYSTLAALIVILLDHGDTLPREIRLVWRWPITLHVIAACRMLLHHLDPSSQEVINQVIEARSRDDALSAHISSAHGSERSKQSRNLMQEVSRQAPSVGPGSSTQSGVDISSADSLAIQVVPRSVSPMSTGEGPSESESGLDSDAVEFTVEGLDSASSITSISRNQSSSIEIGSEHTTSSINSAEQREFWNDILEDRSSMHSHRH
ncbi:hypothetical protein CVT24_010755 [Panaeolus cyanescens]|uniref:DUF6533 domain-containing protein n=1 Tax=Panaeolus cyanescens TaxID=181874 RepID=A0A409YMA2_9AGAR|nr:hypothetical protein CVT24_010755 [Panaeolus cyanescens]